MLSLAAFYYIESIKQRVWVFFVVVVCLFLIELDEFPMNSG